MALLSAKDYRPREVTSAEAEAAIAQRPDIPAKDVENARTIGPAALLLLAQQYPTPEALSAAEREKQRQLRLAECRRVARRARIAMDVLEGKVPGLLDDASRRDALLQMGSLRHEVELLSWWHDTDTQGFVATPEEWARVRKAAETIAVKELVLRFERQVESVKAELHPSTKKRRKNQT